MPQEPKRRHSTGRKGKRRASIHLDVKASTKCLNCGSVMIPHNICKACGFYKGVQITKSSAVKK